ncbi:hypothetical protein E2C01_071025 [Portunus trituberculatus]|uniref:Uncharacterized protein n=1 Tax=Portunus trituberculatus TaxID=210409 RepID=A0A5B7I6W7_PORTR|nr:hypothetical protein [Portunus trituberculatus]
MFLAPLITIIHHLPSVLFTHPPIPSLPILPACLPRPVMFPFLTIFTCQSPSTPPAEPHNCWESFKAATHPFSSSC